MIDQWSGDASGWARFSDDMTMRYRLARSLTTIPLTVDESNGHVMTLGGSPAKRICWVMCNPSTADAFQLDPTVKRCVAFAKAWGADVLEIVNVFALRSTDPQELYKRATGYRGDDSVANEQILQAVRGAHRVIAAWGKHGALGGRAAVVRGLLDGESVTLHHVGVNGDGSPKHPLYVRGGTEPQEWISP